ncbi:MAG: transporter substrate-binding domain-containing protein [Phaeospirillum sp.]|nr:transporter substrate-binding domain-containing protein [Phaeospirillum sp.]
MWFRNLTAGLSLAVALICPETRPAMAGNVSVAIGLSLSPYVIPDEKRGLEYDIVKQALALEGHTMVPQYVPLARVAKMMEIGRTDGAMTQQAEPETDNKFSEPYIAYRNVAITLASRNIKVERIEDLAGKTVLAFQNATTALGPAFKATATGSPTYREEAKQVTHPILLYLGRVDVVIADRNIFNWFAHTPEVTSKVDANQAIRHHHLFAPTEYRMAFRDAGLRDSFNRGLAKLRESGEYARIVAHYAPLMSEENPQ